MDRSLPPRPPNTKGTVTSLASVFPVEEIQKASQRVQDALNGHQKHLDQLHEFIGDNASLINLVQRLPNELRHDIMVPFGKAAFFPGKLVHTNEFLVLLGEGYYVERSSKQTVDILRRRGKELENQVEAVKAEMQDLKAEASFFNATAIEALEGLVEIREDYVEEASDTMHSKSAGVPMSDSSVSLETGNSRPTVEDEEYDHIFARIAELEKEEEAENAPRDDDFEEVESSNKNDDEYDHMFARIAELEKEEEEAENAHRDDDFEEVESSNKIDDDDDDDDDDDETASSASEDDEDERNNDVNTSVGEYNIGQDVRNMEVHHLSDRLERQGSLKDLSEGSSLGQLLVEGPKHLISRDGFMNNKDLAFTEPVISKKAVKLPETNESTHALVTSKEEVCAENYNPSGSSKVFIGSIVERAPHHSMNSTNQMAVGRSSKPVSRFKLQRK